MTTRVVLDAVALDRLLTGETGPVFRAVIDGATRVQDAARVDVGKDTQDLERSIVKRPSVVGDEVRCLVGSSLEYALIHHEGRGEVVPVNAKALRFRTRAGTVVFTQRSKAVPPNRYLTNNVRKALP